jgi:hypothetical protein
MLAQILSSMYCQIIAYHNGMTELLAVAALNFREVSRLWALLREMALFFAVAARSVSRILGLIALLGHVVLGATVVAGALGNVGALLRVSQKP